jgi:hypothetical protein
MTGTDQIAGPTRAAVGIPTESGDEIEAWLYLPEGDGPHPAVVLAQGIGAPGVSVPRQRDDYGTVIGWAAAQPGIDARRVFAWARRSPACTSSSSPPPMRGSPGRWPNRHSWTVSLPRPWPRPRRGLRLFSLAVLDRIGAIFGQKLMTPKDGTEWHDRVAARSLLSFSWRRPVRRAAAIRCPLLLVVAERDTMAPVVPAPRVVEKAHRAELYRSRGGHYDVYEGGADHDTVLSVEVEFLHRVARSPAP